MKGGLLIMDKMKGVSCRKIDIALARRFGMKVGHCGTLDPNASGVLPILVGPWVRMERIFQEKDKEYVGVAKFHSDVEMKDVKEVAERFTGEIVQIPPRKSAVSRKPRRRRVYSIELLERRGRYFLMRFHVEAGTYIRKLVHDMGEMLGGAHLVDLRRTRSGEITEDDCQGLEDIIRGEFLNPVEWAGIESIEIERDSERIRKGMPIFRDNVKRFPAKPTKWLAVYSNGELVCIARYKGEEKIYASPDIVIR